jgi:hypothetical protein
MEYVMRKSLHLAVAIAAAFFFFMGSASAKEAPNYSVTRVVPFAPYTSIAALGVNDSGHFYGGASNLSGGVWIFWTPEDGVVELQPPSGTIVNVSDINNVDELAVNSTVGPWIWSPSSGWRSLSGAKGAVTTQVLSRNDRGQTVGVAFDGDGGLFDTSRRAVKWSIGGEVTEVRPFNELVPAMINEHGDVAGTAFRPGTFGMDRVPVLADHGSGYQALSELPDGPRGFASGAVGLSENGLVAINSPNFLGDVVACYWNARKGTQAITELPSTAMGVSRRGTVLGRMTYAYYSFSWNRQWGMINIAAHLEPGSQPLVGFTAYGISGSGIIAGSEFLGTTNTAVILVPDKAD